MLSDLIQTNESDRQIAFLKFVEEHDDIAIRMKLLRDEKKALRVRIKEAEFTLKSFDATLALREEDPVLIAAHLEGVRAQLEWLGKSVGYQADMFPIEPSTALPAPSAGGIELTEAQQRAVRADGHHAGRRGADRHSGNTWVPGSMAHAIWDEGWVAGAEELEQWSRLEEPAVETRGRRGRPAGARDSRPRQRRSRKAANGAEGATAPQE